MKRILLLIVMALITQTIKAQTVTIGTQTWTTKNLDVANYSDGTPIPQVTEPTTWTNLTTGAWRYYNDNPANGVTYGKLYNWYAVAGIWNEASKTDISQRKNLGPTGYHVPTDEEWETLIAYLGGYYVAGGKMKEIGTAHWISPNTDATNSSGLTSLPGGSYDDSYGTFGGIGTYGNWWGSSDYNSTYAGVGLLSYNTGGANSYDRTKAAGLSVRCLKDTSSLNISNNNNKGYFKIYPNPFSNSITIDCSNISNIANQPYSITDALGKIVLKGILNESDTTFNVEHLSKGIYYIKVANNKAIKFIKE